MVEEPAGITVYRNDVVVKVKGGRQLGSGGERGEIERLSEESLRRLAFVASNTDVEFTTMITLTYPGEWESNGRIVKSHLKAFIQFMRRRIRPLSYLWFLEFQERGAPHFHILFVGYLDKTAVSSAWYEIVGSGDEFHLAAGTRVEAVEKQGGARRYAVKYAQKARQKGVPEVYRSVGRFWGHSKDVKPVARGYGTVGTEGAMRELLSGWSYADRAIERGYGTLYNAAEIVRENVNKMISEGKMLVQEMESETQEQDIHLPNGVDGNGGGDGR